MLWFFVHKTIRRIHPSGSHTSYRKEKNLILIVFSLSFEFFTTKWGSIQIFVYLKIKSVPFPLNPSSISYFDYSGFNFNNFSHQTKQTFFLYSGFWYQSTHTHNSTRNNYGFQEETKDKKHCKKKLFFAPQKNKCKFIYFFLILSTIIISWFQIHVAKYDQI